MTEDPRWRSLLPAEPLLFEEGFQWGVGSSAFQSEGGEVPNDWAALAREGRFPPNPGNGFWERAEEDFRLVASLGIRNYRLSIEWSRVEPERGRFDEAALDRYRAICDAACDAGVTPWVNLFHFTHPKWFADRGGFLDPRNHDDFLRYAEHLGRALHGHAEHFHSQNESMVYVLGAYLTGQLPPFVTDRDRAYQMTRCVLVLHARTYGILKEIDSRHQIATIEVYLNFQAEEPDDEANLRSVQELDRWYHGSLLEGLATGRIELPGCEPEEIPGLRGALDAYGFNYYATTRIGKSGIGSYSDLEDPPVDAMGRAVHPRGLEEGLLRVSSALPGVPILVTENGCPTTDESFRIRYLAAHLSALDRARRAGADLRGYFHWTAVDNYEWEQGFSDARFGLIDFDPASLERRPKRSAHWLAEVIRRGELDPATIP
jgi:beta-glucosidase